MAAATNPPMAAPMKKLEEATGAEGDGGEAASPAAETAVESGADSTAPSISNDGTAGARKKLDRNGLSLVMGRTANSKKMKRLHHEIKTGDPKKIDPLPSFSIDCKGDVCKGDIILFKQKVSEERKGKQDKQCIGRRTIAGKVVEEEYTEMRQLHNFTIMLFWSEGVRNLPALHQLVILGHHLYRFMTWQQEICSHLLLPNAA